MMMTEADDNSEIIMMMNAKFMMIMVMEMMMEAKL